MPRGSTMAGRPRVEKAECELAEGGENAAAARFMGSLHDSKIAHRDHEPGRDALLRVQAERQLGPTRFMGSVTLAAHRA